MYRVFVFLSLVFLATPLHAGPDRYSLLLGSKHIGATSFNELNPGVFLTWEQSHSAFSLGAFYNSYKRVSLAATQYRPLKTWANSDAGLFAGLAFYPVNGKTFKTHLGGDMVFIGGLQARHQNLFVQLVPMTAGGADGLLSFGVTFAAR